MSYEFNMPDGDSYIKAYWSKTFIVKMHRIPDINPFYDVNDIFDAFDQSKNGVTKIILVDGRVLTEEDSRNDMKNDKEGTLIPVFKSGITEDRKNIKNIKKIYFRILGLIAKNNSAFNPKRVVYKIAFGDENGNKYETVKQNNNTAEANLENMTVNSAILHIWLIDLDK